MTIASTNKRNNYTGTGTVGPFPFTFRVNGIADLRVTRRSVSGIEYLLTALTDYTAVGFGAPTGGAITLITALGVGEILTIRRVVTLTQNTDLRNQGVFFPETHEDVFDRLTMIDQQQQDQLDRALKFSETVDPATVSGVLPIPIPGKAIGWSPDGKSLVNSDLVGATGPTGVVQGPTGVAGPAGPQGPFGVEGPQGPIGVQGPVGPQGPVGVTGPQGPQGVQGIPGGQGPTGVQGPSGTVGPTWKGTWSGATAYALNDVVYYTTTGSSYICIQAGTNHLPTDTAYWSLYSFQGVQGSTGPTGALGPSGLAGPQGATGVQGTQGTQGPTGVQGPQGLQGIAGPQGPQGTAGVQGPQGPAGAAGPTGVQGPGGAAGPQGPAGAAGPTGAAGPVGATGPLGQSANIPMNTGSTTHPGDGGGSTIVTLTTSGLPSGTTYDISWHITDPGGASYGTTDGAQTGVSFPYTLTPTCGFGPGIPSGQIIVTANFLGKEIGHGTYSGTFAL